MKIKSSESELEVNCAGIRVRAKGSFAVVVVALLTALCMALRALQCLDICGDYPSLIRGARAAFCLQLAEDELMVRHCPTPTVAICRIDGIDYREQVRFYNLQGKRLAFTSTPAKNPLDGQEVVHEVLWERLTLPVN
jgi:hypothetical protein